MISQFSVFGSCVSRNMFNSLFNLDYKSFFNINHSVNGVSMVSLMSKPVEVDESLLCADRQLATDFVGEDFSKNYANTIENENLDYILMDTYFDSRYGILKLDDDSYITNSFWLKECYLYEMVKDLPKVNMQDTLDEYLNLWEDSCERFFKLVDKNKSHPKVILNLARSVYRHSDGSQILVNEDFKRRSSVNMYWDILDKYILENYDVEVLTFNRNTLCDLNHMFGPAPEHYERDYYTTKIDQLKDIISRNSLLDYDNEINAKFRQFMRNRSINRL